MAKLLIVTVGVRSHLNSCLEFSRCAGELGHQVEFCSQNTNIRRSLRRQGLSFHPLKSAATDALPSSRLSRILSLRLFRKVMRQKRDVLLSGAGLLELLQSLKPDLVLLDSELHELILIASSVAPRVAVLEYHISPFRFHGVPTLSSLHIPTWEFASNIRATLSWKFLYLRRALSRVWRLLLLGTAA